MSVAFHFLTKRSNQTSSVKYKTREIKKQKKFYGCNKSGMISSAQFGRMQRHSLLRAFWGCQTTCILDLTLMSIIELKLVLNKNAQWSLNIKKMFLKTFSFTFLFHFSFIYKGIFEVILNLIEFITLAAAV